MYLFPFCNQTSLLINRGGACFDAILFIISTSYSQSNVSIVWGSTREPCKWMERPCIWTIYTARLSNGKRGKKSCSIINITIINATFKLF